VGKCYTYIHTYGYLYIYHVDLNYVYILTNGMIRWNFIIQKLFYEKKLKSSRYHCCSNVWDSEDSNAFSVKLLDILNFFNRFVNLGKIFKNDFVFFHLDKIWKR